MDNTTKNIVLATVAVALLGFAGFRLLGGRSDPRHLPDEIPGAGVCLACGLEVQYGRAPGESEPFECPACGERAVLPWLYCYECDHRFVTNLIRNEDGPARANAFPICPHCNCRNFGAFMPESGRQAPVGDAPLPKWP